MVMAVRYFNFIIYIFSNKISYTFNIRGFEPDPQWLVGRCAIHYATWTTKGGGQIIFIKKLDDRWLKNVIKKLGFSWSKWNKAWISMVNIFALKKDYQNILIKKLTVQISKSSGLKNKMFTSKSSSLDA